MNDQPFCYPGQTPEKDDCLMDTPEAKPDLKPAVDPSQPAAGGWVPSKQAQLAATIYCTTAASIAPVLLTLGLPGIIGAAVLAGSAAGVAAFFGIKSAGPRKLD